MYRMLYVKLMATTKQKSTVDKHKTRRKEFKHSTGDNQQNTREDSKRGRNEQKETTKIARK